MSLRRILATLALLAISLYAAGKAPAATPKEYPLWKFDELTPSRSCRAKGRMQDKGYCDSRVVDQVIHDGTSAIPILISQLTNSRKTHRPVFDYWHDSSEGDIAYFLLHDLFTDSDWQTFNMPGLDALRPSCANIAEEQCWQGFVQKHGRKFVQDQWQRAWRANSGRVYWDEKNRCFRLH